MIKKYGNESFGKMARDIKINYLQWSKGQCAKHVSIYRTNAGEIKPEYKMGKKRVSETHNETDCYFLDPTRGNFYVCGLFNTLF